MKIKTFCFDVRIAALSYFFLIFFKSNCYPDCSVSKYNISFFFFFAICISFQEHNATFPVICQDVHSHKMWEKKPIA